MKKKLKRFCSDLNIKVGIADVGPYKKLEKVLVDRQSKNYITGFEEKDIQKRINPKLEMEDAKSVIVCIFPYNVSKVDKSNISKYTHSNDYHIVCTEYMRKINEFLSSNIDDFKGKVFVDNGPLVDRYMAYLSGLGYFGINNNLINDEYGSYFFIGYIINNYMFEADTPVDKMCINCKKCVDNCPGNAILDNFDFNPRKCASYLTQKKEELTEFEMNIIKKSNCIFGCDICQSVCPHNQGIKQTPIDEFKNDLLFNLEYDEILNISNKEFKRKYKSKAFSWRGKKIILRNLDIVKSNIK